MANPEPTRRRTRSTLGRRLTLTLAGSLLFIAALAVVATLAIQSINRNLTGALTQYDRLRLYFDLGVDITRARTLAALGSEQRDQALLRTQAAVIRLRDSEARPPESEKLLETLLEAERRLSRADDTTPAITIVSRLDVALNQISRKIRSTTDAINRIEQNRQRQSETGMLVVIGGASLAVIAVALLGVLLYRRIMKPLHQLQQGVERVRGGALDYRLVPTGDRELADLADRFNDMTRELETLYHDLETKVRTQSRQLAQSERLASVGHLAAGVAHEINNPLGIIVGEIELAQHQNQGDPRLLELVMEQAMRCKRMTQRLLSLASIKAGQRRDVDVVAFAERQVQRASKLPQAEGLTIRVDAKQVAGDLTMHTDPDLAGQVVSNLLSNACEASTPGNDIILIVSTDQQHVHLTVRDQGCGMTQEQLRNIFEPFYTSKRGVASGGHGLGLSISHAIVETLGGQITATSDGPGQGSRFTLSLPLRYTL